MTLDLTTPTDHADAYPWASVLLAHGFIGLWMWVTVSFVVPPLLGAVAVPAAYLLAWEGAVQRCAAGILDALVDTAGVVIGPVFGILAMIMALSMVDADWNEVLRAPVPLTQNTAALWLASTIAAGFVLAGGVWKRIRAR